MRHVIKRRVCNIIEGKEIDRDKLDERIEELEDIIFECISKTKDDYLNEKTLIQRIYTAAGFSMFLKQNKLICLD